MKKIQQNFRIKVMQEQKGMKNGFYKYLQVPLQQPKVRSSYVVV